LLCCAKAAKSARASIGACVEGVPRVSELSLVAHVPHAHEIEGREGQQRVDYWFQDTACLYSVYVRDGVSPRPHERASMRFAVM
jgi:hypothetical protein